MRTERGEQMKWNSRLTESYQETVTGTARAHSKYYIYKAGFGEWYAGRYAFGRDIDFRIQFTSAQAARNYIATYDEEALIVTAV